METIDKNNTDERIELAKYYTKKRRNFNIPIVLWNNNIYNNIKIPVEIFEPFIGID